MNKVITQGLPASPGAACGQIVFHADDAQEWHEDGKKVIMVRIETSPDQPYREVRTRGEVGRVSGCSRGSHPLP